MADPCIYGCPNEETRSFLPCIRICIKHARGLSLLRRSHLGGLSHLLPSRCGITLAGLWSFWRWLWTTFGIRTSSCKRQPMQQPLRPLSLSSSSLYPSSLFPCDPFRPSLLPFPSWSWQHPLALVRLGPRPCLNNHLVVSTEAGRSKSALFFFCCSSSIARSTFSHNHAVVRL